MLFINQVQVLQLYSPGEFPD